MLLWLPQRAGEMFMLGNVEAHDNFQHLSGNDFTWLTWVSNTLCEQAHLTVGWKFESRFWDLKILKCLEWGRLLIFTWNDDFRVTNTKRLFRGDCVCSWTRHFYHKLRHSPKMKGHIVVKTSIKTPLATGLLIKRQPGGCLLYGSLCWYPTVSAAPHTPAERI